MPGHADGEALAAILAIPGLTTAEAGSALSGRGVGLDAVRVAVERLGGTLAVRANPGVGAAFVMTVPLKESRASAA
jgi:two-component system chemotaxis sensor kinase CheA